MANTYTSLTYHIVFSTKLRRKLIRRDVESELHKYIAGIIREHKSQPLEIGGVEDHIHIVTGIAPTIALSDMVRLIKANSSKWFNEIHARNVKFGWQTGYAAFTVSQSQSSAVRKRTMSPLTGLVPRGCTGDQGLAPLANSFRRYAAALRNITAYAAGHHPIQNL